MSRFAAGTGFAVVLTPLMLTRKGRRKFLACSSCPSELHRESCRRPGGAQRSAGALLAFLLVLAGCPALLHLYPWPVPCSAVRGAKLPLPKPDSLDCEYNVPIAHEYVLSKRRCLRCQAVEVIFLEPVQLPTRYRYQGSTVSRARLGRPHPSRGYPGTPQSGSAERPGVL